MIPSPPDYRQITLATPYEYETPRPGLPAGREGGSFSNNNSWSDLCPARELRRVERMGGGDGGGGGGWGWVMR